MIRRVAVVAVSLGLLSLGACASAARPDAMTVLPSTVAAAKAGDVGYQAVKIVNVSGGTDTNPLLWSEVASGDFRLALERNDAVPGGFLLLLTSRIRPSPIDSHREGTHRCATGHIAQFRILTNIADDSNLSVHKSLPLSRNKKS
jgi:hypothetical protein